MSHAKRSALSFVTPDSRCTRVPAAGMKPEDNAVEPWARASRSSSTQATPASRRIRAAVSPHAPAPTMATGTSGVPGGICRALTTVGVTALGSRRRAVQVLAARLADHLAVFEDLHAAQESGIDSRRHLQPLERRVALGRGRVLGGDGPGTCGVDERDVGVEAFGDVALAVQAEALRRIPTRHTGHVVVAHAAARAFAHQRGQQILGAAEAALGHPDIAEIAPRDLHLVTAAGVVADHPVEL